MLKILIMKSLLICSVVLLFTGCAASSPVKKEISIVTPQNFDALKAQNVTRNIIVTDSLSPISFLGHQ